MLRYNIQDMSEMELSELSQAIIAEREKRNNAKKEQAWSAVRTAIMDYCRQFGDIEVRAFDEGETDISIYSDLESIGYIEVS